MSRIARAVVLASVFPAIVAVAGCAAPDPHFRAHPWKPPGFRPHLFTETSTYAEFPPSIEAPPRPPQGQPSDG